MNCLLQHEKANLTILFDKYIPTMQEAIKHRYSLLIHYNTKSIGLASSDMALVWAY